MNNNFYYTESQKELNESYYDDDDFYLKELLDKLEDNRRAIEIYTLDITQPDEEYALTQEEKDRTIKMLKEYYKQAEEKEKILESILEEAQDIYRNYAEIIRQEKVMIEDAFEEVNIPLEESLNESQESYVIKNTKNGKYLSNNNNSNTWTYVKDKNKAKTFDSYEKVFDFIERESKQGNSGADYWEEEILTEDISDVKKNFKDFYLSGNTKENDSAKEFKKSKTIEAEVENVRQDMKNLANYLDRWYEKNIAHQYGMAVDLSGFDEQAFLNFRNSLMLSDEEIKELDDFRLNENKKKKNYLKQLQDFANKHQKGLGRFTKYGGKTNTNAGNVEVNNAFFNSVSSSDSSQAMGNGGQAMGEKLTLCEDKIEEKELAQLSSGLYEYFIEKDLYVEDMWYQKDNRICYSISQGDWKHEHGRSTYLAQEYLYEKGYYITSSEQEITEDDGSDTYSSIHYLEIEPIGIKESLNESYVIVGVDKDDHKRKFYDTDSKEWTEDETKATKFEDLISSQETWKDIDKEQFEKTFIPIYDKKEDVNNENK